MKKIFAVSILSLMTVITASDALANASPNYNLATVEYVEEKVGDVFWNDVVRVMDVVPGLYDENRRAGHGCGYHSLRPAGGGLRPDRRPGRHQRCPEMPPGHDCGQGNW